MLPRVVEMRHAGLDRVVNMILAHPTPHGRVEVPIRPGLQGHFLVERAAREREDRRGFSVGNAHHG